MSALAALARKDSKAFLRDRFLLMIAFYTLAMALICRLLVPFVPVRGLDLYLAPAVVMMGAMLLGTLFGFGLIEEREQGTWLLLRVLPLGETALFAYLAGSAAFASLVMAALGALVYGYPVARAGTFAGMLLASALAGPLVMLLLGALASNKIEGMAFSKMVSASGLVAASVFVLPAPWQLLVGLFPWYWLYVGLLEAFAANPQGLTALYWPGYPTWLPPLAASALSLSGTLFLLRVYRRRAS